MKLKNAVYSLTLFFILVPFILVTDIFPFLRFGMFAEPVKEQVQTELFFVLYKKSDGNWYRFDPENYELQEESFQYLVRNYYYRKEADILLKKLQKSDINMPENWRLFKVSFPVSSPDKKDTLLISAI